jgi:hypothetical protein
MREVAHFQVAEPDLAAVGSERDAAGVRHAEVRDRGERALRDVRSPVLAPDLGVDHASTVQPMLDVVSMHEDASAVESSDGLEPFLLCRIDRVQRCR